MEHLTPSQKEVVDECLAKGSGGLSLPMGSGKTLISLVVSLTLSPVDPILVVVPKTLLTGLVHEMNKFLQVPYEILHPEYTDVRTWTVSDITRVVLTTTQTLTKFYREYGIENHFVYRVPNEAVGYTNLFQTPEHPLLSSALVTRGGGTVYTRTWGALVVDEAHGCCNILVDKCRCIAAVCARHRWFLSGTMFSEPKPANLLGYYVMIGHPENPGSLSQMTMWMRRAGFPGVRPTLVYRDEVVRDYEVETEVIETPLTEEEATFYRMGRDILSQIGRELEQTADTNRRRRYSAYLLAMITYLRQTLIAPIIVLASIALDICKIEERSHLSEIINTQLQEAGLGAWLNDPASICSSRLGRVLRSLEEDVPDRRVVLFSAFRTSLRLLQHFIRDRPVFDLPVSASSERRQEILTSFASSKGGVLLLTYRMGAEGLNLQCSDTVFLLDTMWNSTSASQAIARVARQGQLSEKVKVKIFVGNTGMEKAILEKQIIKNEIGKQIMTGPTRQRYHQMRVKDVLRLVEAEANGTLCRYSIEQSIV